MAKVMAVWAIDIGQAALKALKLVPSDTPEFVVAEAFDFIEYPKILSQPDAEPEELVSEALTTFLGRNDLKGARVAVAVPGQAGLVKFIKLPPVEKKRIPDIVKFEARQQIPFALEEVIWDYQPIGGDEEAGGEEEDAFAQTEVGLFAMKRDQIYRAIQPLKAAGIEVDVVQMSPIALFNFAAFDRPRGEGKPDGSVVYLDVGADNTDLIITDGVRIWQRNVPIGGNHFTRALTKELKLTFAKAEHLKRNATKSQDPRAVFTAMRGVFGDLASEVSRSIGFYSSVNRQAKIAKVVGLGNGFKLPGLQKFLQQNLNQEVEKLEVFDKLVGEEVTTAPQFTDNLMSFAVAYGLGLQGLELAPLTTNLLPPEIEQVRMIRRKKPWALVASALMLLAFSALFLGDWRALAKVQDPEMQEAVGRAKSVASTGSQYKSSYDSAKAAFDAKKTEGELLVEPAASQIDWAELLRIFNARLPDPARELELDPNAPQNQEILQILRVHVDSILPRYSTDLATDWYSGLEEWSRDYMHPYDQTNPPEGEGWVIHVIGHHYNPPFYGVGSEKLSDRLKNYEPRIVYGPFDYLTLRVVPRLWGAELRQKGIHHATLEWFAEPDYAWETSKAATGTAVAKAPILPRPTPETVSMAMGAMEGGSMMEMMPGDLAAMEAMYNDESAMAGMMPGMMESAMGYYPGMMPGGVPGKEAEKSTMTRTDFLITFLWQPPEPDAEPKSIEEIQAELVAAVEAAGQGALRPLTPEEFAAVKKQSTERQQQAVKKQVEAVKKRVEASTEAGGEAAPDAPADPAAPATPDATPPPAAPGAPPAGGAAPPTP